jgi:hypothetical protein
MSSAQWLVIAGLVLTVLLNLAGYLVAWGVMKGTVADLRLRVEGLESEMSAMREINGKIIRLETKVDGIFEQLRDLNTSIRWMREPAEYMPPPPTPRRRKP